MKEFNELKNAYLIQRRNDNIAKNTMKGITGSLNRFGTFLDEKNLTLADIDRKSDMKVEIDTLETSKITSNNMIDYFIMYLRDEKEYAHSTIKTTVTYVNKFLKYLHTKEFIEYNIMENYNIAEYIDYGETQQKKEWGDNYVAISKQQHKEIVGNVPPPVFRNKLICNLLWTTGMRRSEIANITLDDIHLEERRIDVPAIKSDERSVFFPRAVQTQLSVWISTRRESCFYADKSEYVFVTDRSERIHPNQIGAIVKQGAECLPDQKFITSQDGQERAKYSTHSYRHGFAEHFIQQSEEGTGQASIYTLKELMGHSSVDVTEQYLNNNKDEWKKQQMDSFAPTV